MQRNAFAFVLPLPRSCGHAGRLLALVLTFVPAQPSGVPAYSTALRPAIGSVGDAEGRVLTDSSTNGSSAETSSIWENKQLHDVLGGKVNYTLKWIIVVLFCIMWAVLFGVVVEAVCGRDKLSLAQRADQEALKQRQAATRKEVEKFQLILEKALEAKVRSELTKEALSMFSASTANTTATGVDKGKDMLKRRLSKHRKHKGTSASVSSDPEAE